jgi:hypothetical protein
MKQPAVFRIKKFNDAAWIFPDGGDTEKSVAFTVSAVAGTKTDKQDITTGVFLLKFTAADVEISVDKANLYNTNRGPLRDAFDQFKAALDGLQADNSLANGGARLIIQATAQYLPLPLTEVAAYHYSLQVPDELDGIACADLLPGMRLQVYYSNFYTQPGAIPILDPPGSKTLSAYGGTGSDEIYVNAVAGSSNVSFDPFLNQMNVSVKPLASGKGRVASGVIDMVAPADQKPYNRLFYPGMSSRFAAVDVPDYKTKNNVAIVRADSYDKMSGFTSNITSADNVSGAVTRFFGRTALVPEISVRVNGTQQYVPLGTTLTQLAEREMQSITRPKNLRFLRMINQFPVAVTFEDLFIGYNMFLIQGDDISW